MTSSKNFVAATRPAFLRATTAALKQINILLYDSNSKILQYATVSGSCSLQELNRVRKVRDKNWYSYRDIGPGAKL